MQQNHKSTFCRFLLRINCELVRPICELKRNLSDKVPFLIWARILNSNVGIPAVPGHFTETSVSVLSSYVHVVNEII